MHDNDISGRNRLLKSSVWVVSELPRSPELISLPADNLSFTYQGEQFLARFSNEATLFGGLECEAAIFQAIGDHPNIQEFVGIKEINGVYALVFRNNAGMPLAQVIHNASSLGRASACMEFDAILRLLARGLMSGVDAVHRAGYICGDLTAANFSVHLPTMEVKLNDLSAARAFGSALNAYAAESHASSAAESHASDTSDNVRLSILLSALQSTTRQWEPLAGSAASASRSVQDDWSCLIAALSDPDRSRRRPPGRLLAQQVLPAPSPSEHALERFRSMVSSADLHPALDVIDSFDGVGAASVLASGSGEDAPSVSNDDEEFEEFIVAELWPCPEESTHARVALNRSPSVSSNGSEIFVDTVETLTPHVHMRTASDLIRAFAGKMLIRLVGDLLATRYAELHALCCDVSELRRSSGNAADQLGRLIVILNEHRDRIPVDYLRYLDAITNGLISIQPVLAIRDVDNERDRVGQVQYLAAAIEELLKAPDVAAVTSGAIDRFIPYVQAIKAGAALLQSILSLDWDHAPPFDAFLRVMLDGPALAEFMGPKLHGCLTQVESALRIASDLSVATRQLNLDPRAGTIPRLAGALTDSSLEAYLPAGWRSSPAYRALDLFRDFPLEGRYSQQIEWLTLTLRQPSAQPMLKPIMEAFSDSGEVDARALTLLKALSSLTDPSLSYREKASAMASGLTSTLPPSTILSVARPLISSTPYVSTLMPPLESVVAWYTRQPSGLPWHEMSARFCGHVVAELRRHPQALAGLIPVPGVHYGAQAIASYLSLPAGMSWAQTIAWASEQATRSPTIKPYYDGYMVISLLWKLSGVLRESVPMEQQELALEEIAHSLKQHLTASTYLGLEKVLDVLVYLPALREIGPKSMVLLRQGSWRGWTEGVIELVANSSSPALRRLGHELEEQALQAVSDGLVRAFDVVAAVGSDVAQRASGALAGMNPVAAASSALAALSKIDPLPLNAVLADAAPTPSPPKEAQMQEMHAELLLAGMDDKLAEQTVREHFDTTAKQGPLDSTAAVTTTTNSADSDTPPLTDDQWMHLADGFNPFDDVAESSPISETLATALLALPWVASAYMVHSIYADYRRADRETRPASETIPLSDVPLASRAFGDSHTDDGATGHDHLVSHTPILAEPPGFAERAIKPLALAALLAVSIGTTYAVARRGQEEPLDEAQEEPSAKTDLTGVPQPGASEGLKVRRDVAASWQASIRSTFSFDYGPAVNQRLGREVDNAIRKTLDDNVSSQSQSAHFLQALDLALATYAETLPPATVRETAHEHACVHLERMRVRVRLDAELAMPTVRTGPAHVLPTISPAVARYDEAFELQKIDTTAYAAALDNLRDKSESAALIRQVEDLLYDEPDLSQLPLRQVRIWSPPLPNREQHRVQSIHEQGISKVDPEFLTHLINGIRSPGKTVKTLITELTTKYAQVRFNIGRDIYTQRESLAAGGMSSEDTLLVEQSIRMKQVAKHHVTVLFNQAIKYLGMLDRLPPETFSRRLSPGRANVEAKVEAARLTLQEFGRGPSAPFSDKDLYYFYGEIHESGDPDIQWYLNHAAILLHAIFVGGVSPEVVALGQQKQTASSFLSSAQDPEFFFPWCKSMADLFRKADVPNVKRLTDPDPPGFVGIGSFKRSNGLTWKAYFDQFAEFEEKYAKIEAGKYNYAALISEGFDDFDLSLTPNSAHVLELVCFEENWFSYRLGLPDDAVNEGPAPPPVPGKVGVIELQTGEVVVVTSIEGRIMAKRFSKQEAQRNETLRHITSGTRLREVDWCTASSSAPPLYLDKLVNNLIKPLWGSVEASPLARHGRYAMLAQRSYSDPYALAVSGRSLLELSDELATQGLVEVAEVIKAADMDPTVWHSMASMFVPFYTTAFNAYYDRNSRVDIASVLLDVVSVVAVLVPAGIELNALGRAAEQAIHSAIAGGLQAGHKGAALIRATAMGLARSGELVRAGVSAAKIAGLAAYQLVEPIPFSLVARPIAVKLIQRVGEANRGATRAGAAAVEVSRRGKSLTLHLGKWGESENPLTLTPRKQQQLAVATVRKDMTVTGAEGPSLKPITYAWWSKQAPSVMALGGKDMNLRAVVRKVVRSDFKGLASRRPEARGVFVYDCLKAGGYFGSSPLNVIAKEFLKIGSLKAIERPRRVRSLEELVQMPAGNVVLFFDRRGFPGDALPSQHIMLSIGDGWFAGVRNDLLPRGAFSEGASLMPAEELSALITDDVSVYHGACRDTVLRPRRPAGPMPNRVWSVLGGDVADFAAADGTVSLKAHGAPFNVAGMDAIELGRFIKAQAAREMAGPIQRVKLTACESAKDLRLGNVSVGQVLADFLEADVYAFEEEVNGFNRALPNSEAVKKLFRPRVITQGRTPELLRQIERDRARHMYWHDASVEGSRKITALKHLNRSSPLGRTGRTADRVEPQRELDQVLQKVATFVVGKSSVTEFFGYMYPRARNTDQDADNFHALSIFKAHAASASDGQSLHHLMAILSMKPEWVSLVERG